MGVAADTYLEQHFEQHLGRIQEFIKKPTVSTEDRGLVEGAWMLGQYLREAGFTEVALVDTPGRPGVWARIDVGAPKTIASYGFFDSRPVGDESSWTYQPFSGRIVNHSPFGRVLIGRGSLSPKGPLIAWINALEAMIQTESLPVNVMLLLEGEEILGSPHYPEMFTRYRTALSTADACFAGGMTQGTSGEVSIALGSRGFLVLEVEVSGERWGRGPAGRSLHSSLKNIVDSPASRLAHLLSRLTDETGSGICIRGLADPAMPPSDEDLMLTEALLEQLKATKISSAIGLGNIPPADDLRGRELLMGYMFRPSLNINGLYAGYTGPGTEVFTIPHRATARLDLRLPPGVTCDHVISCMNSYLQETGFQDAELRVIARHDWSRTPVNEAIVQAVIDVYQERGLRPTIWPYRGGGGPWSLFANELQIPLIIAAGLGGGGVIDGNDEFLIIDGNERVAGLVEAEKSHVAILDAFARR